MKQPKPGKLFTHARYWPLVDMHHQITGAFPTWGHDFISIHNHYNDFKLVSPLCICYTCGAEGRPAWEEQRFSSFRSALRRARRLSCVAKLRHALNVFVVDCRDVQGIGRHLRSAYGYDERQTIP